MIAAFILSTVAMVNAAFAASFVVQVGLGGILVFSPASLDGVAAGDTINFTFNPGNHTVTQSSFDTPCNHLSGGFSTGFVPVDVNAPPVVQSFVVPPSENGTTPLWFYCDQSTHCQMGMVFAINAPQAPNPDTFDAFQTRAMTPPGLTDSNSASLSSSTFSGSISAPISINDGPTGILTTSNTSPGIPASTGMLPSSSSGAGASATTTAKSGGLSSKPVESTLTVCSFLFALVSRIVF